MEFSEKEKETFERGFCRSRLWASTLISEELPSLMLICFVNMFLIRTRLGMRRGLVKWGSWEGHSQGQSDGRLASWVVGSFHRRPRRGMRCRNRAGCCWLSWNGRACQFVPRLGMNRWVRSYTLSTSLRCDGAHHMRKWSIFQMWPDLGIIKGLAAFVH